MRTSLVLVFLVALLGFVLWLTREDGGGAGDGNRELQVSLLGGKHLLDADKIVFRSDRDMRPIHLERRDHRWHIVEPLVDFASSGRLMSLAQQYDTALLMRTYKPSEIDDDLLAQTGLDQPRGEVALYFGDDEIRVEIGDEGPLGGVFIRMGQEIHRGGMALWGALQGIPDDFREHSVFETEFEEVERIAVMRKSGADDREESLVLERGRDGTIRLRDPIDVRVEQALAMQFIAEILGMRADQFLSGTMGLRPQPDFVVEVQGVSGKESLKVWVQGEESLIALVEPRGLEFSIKKSRYGQMLKIPAEQLRSRLLIPFPAEQASKLRISLVDPGAKHLQFERGVGNLLKVTLPVHCQARATPVGKLIHALRNLGAHEFVSDPGPSATYGLDSGFLTVELTGPFDIRPTVLHIGKDAGEFTFVKRADEPHIVKAAKVHADVLRSPWTDFVALDIYRNDVPGQIARMVLKRADRSEIYVRGPDGQWRGSDDGSVNTDAETVAAELKDLKGVRVHALEAGIDAADQIEIELQTVEGSEIETLRLLRTTGELTFVRTQRVAVLYEISRFVASAIIAIAPQ